MLKSALVLLICLLSTLNCWSQDSIEENYHFLKWFPDQGASSFDFFNFKLRDERYAQFGHKIAPEEKLQRIPFLNDPSWRNAINQNLTHYAEVLYFKVSYLKAEQRKWRQGYNALKKAKVEKEKTAASKILSDVGLETTGLAYLVCVDDSKTIMDKLKAKGKVIPTDMGHLKTPFFTSNKNDFRFAMYFCVADETSLLFSNKHEVLRAMLESGNGLSASILEGEIFEVYRNYPDELGDERWSMDLLWRRHLNSHEEKLNRGEADEKWMTSHKEMKANLPVLSGMSTITTASGQKVNEINLLHEEASEELKTSLTQTEVLHPGMPKWNKYVQELNRRTKINVDGRIVIKTVRRERRFDLLAEEAWQEKKAKAKR